MSTTDGKGGDGDEAMDDLYDDEEEDGVRDPIVHLRGEHLVEETAKNYLQGDATQRADILEELKISLRSFESGGKPWLGSVSLTSPPLLENTSFGDVVAGGEGTYDASIWAAAKTSLLAIPRGAWLRIQALKIMEVSEKMNAKIASWSDPNPNPEL